MRDRFGERRALIGGLGLTAAAGALALPASAAPAVGGSDWSPSFEKEDAWLDKPGTRHRLMLDATTAPAAESAMFYADTFYAANKSGYALGPESLGVVLVMRHFATPFGYNDKVWSKYGPMFADKLKLQGDQAIRAARSNPLLTAKPAPTAKTKSGDDDAVTLATLAAKGARFGICGVATKGIAEQLAKANGATPASVEAELRANLVPGAVLVAAGIVAVNRAQEHGYAFVYIAD
jgi:intracellular sulfur oxidation DsrE/DsrF family protein